MTAKKTPFSFKKEPFILGDVNAHIPGDVFAYAKGGAPGAGAIASNRLTMTTPAVLLEWAARKRIKTKVAKIFVVQLSPFDKSVIGTIEYKVTHGGTQLKEIKRK